MNADQLPSGVGVAPLRIDSTMLVPAGRSLVEEIEVHEAPAPPSKIRERNVPAAAYGLRRSQSTERLGAPLLNSLARIFKELGIETA